MNKKQLSIELSKRSGLSQVKSMEILNAIFSATDGIIATELYNGNKVTVPGFGTFGTKIRAARIGTNPSTHERIQIPAKRFAYFSAGKILGENVANDSEAGA